MYPYWIRVGIPDIICKIHSLWEPLKVFRKCVFDILRVDLEYFYRLLAIIGLPSHMCSTLLRAQQKH